MSIKQLFDERKPEKYKRVLGVDSSTTGIAWAVCEDGDIVDFGKINLLKQKTMQDRLREIGNEWPDVLADQKPDFVFVEKSILVKNPATFRVLSYIVGSTLAFAIFDGYGVDDIDPATWKAFMGHTNLRRAFVASVKELLGKTEGEKFCVKLRKSQTDRVLKHNCPGAASIDDHDISDAASIALYGFHTMSRPVELQKSKDIAIDLDELHTMGLSL